jgi:hypothetical protein
MILEELKGKRVVIGFADARGMNMTLATFVDCDDKFAKIKAKPLQQDPKIINPGTETYCAIASIDSIVNVDDDKTYAEFLERLKKQQALRDAQLAQMQQMQNGGAPGAPVNAPAEPATEEAPVEDENVTEFPGNETEKEDGKS